MALRVKWIFPTAMFVLCYLHGSDESTVEVSIADGTLKGVLRESRNGTKYYAFYGIPYAKPPVGELRFEAPQPPDPWNGVLNASTPPPKCTQKAPASSNSKMSEVEGQEDCLYLNVYASATNEEYQSLPVMVNIHGGGFIYAHLDQYRADYFMDHPIIYVAMNYRLGVLGFLSAADEILPGNYGLKDQTMALKWVKKNIAAFGGDPNRVTILGGSSGGRSVHLHMHSPLSKGLFHRAFCRSGTALGYGAQIPPDVAREKARAFALLVGCPTKPTRLLVDCLKKLPVKDLISAHEKFRIWDYFPKAPFLPVVEPKSVPNAFLTENPWNQNVVSDVPWIVGSTSGEGAGIAAKLLTNSELLNELNENYVRLFPIIFYFGSWINPHDSANISESIKNYYFGSRNMGKETARELVKLFGDGPLLYDCLEAASRHTNKLFVYYYDHRNKRSFTDKYGLLDMDLGVCHGDDIISTFYAPEFGFPDMVSGADLEVSKRIISYWINFAYTGDPGWPSTNPNDLHYLHITTTSDTMEKSTLNDRYEFWKSLNLHPKHKAYDYTKIKDEL